MGKKKLDPGFRNRITEFLRVGADELQPHPHNWRRHNTRQRATLRAALDDIGMADVIVARRLPDGKLQVLDGHLRVEELGKLQVPVVVVDLTDEEAALFLATHDPLAALAGQDDTLLRELSERIETSQDTLVGLLETMLKPIAPPAPPEEDPDAQIRTIAIQVPEAQYDRVLAALKKIMEANSLETHTDAVLTVLADATAGPHAP